MTGVGLVLIVVVLLFALALTSYTKIKTYRKAAVDGWVRIEEQLSKRTDIISGLTEYITSTDDGTEDNMNTRSSVLKALELASTLNKQALSTESTTDAADAEVAIRTAHLDVNRFMESQLELQKSEAFNETLTNLALTENEITFNQMFYNNAVADYQASMKKFPNSMVAGICGFGDLKPFTFVDMAQKDRGVKRTESSTNSEETL